jgi:hypothetical protein
MPDAMQPVLKIPAELHPLRWLRFNVIVKLPVSLCRYSKLPARTVYPFLPAVPPLHSQSSPLARPEIFQRHRLVITPVALRRGLLGIEYP